MCGQSRQWGGLSRWPQTGSGGRKNQPLGVKVAVKLICYKKSTYKHIYTVDKSSLAVARSAFLNKTREGARKPLRISSSSDAVFSKYTSSFALP